MVQGKSGKWLAIHPSYKLPQEVWLDLPDAEIKKINDERAAFKQSKSGNDNATVISQLTTDTNGMATIQVPVSMIQQAATGTHVSDNSTQQEQDNVGTNPMGGRNEQAQIRSRNNGRS